MWGCPCRLKQTHQTAQAMARSIAGHCREHTEMFVCKVLHTLVALRCTTDILVGPVSVQIACCAMHV
jgi:hypothetical protein